MVLERASKISRVLERMRENWSGVRRGLLLGWEGKIEMWRGFFCCALDVVSFCVLGTEGRIVGRGMHIFAYHA